MSTGSPDARGLVAPWAREALRVLRWAVRLADEDERDRAHDAANTLEAELERLAAERDEAKLAARQAMRDMRAVQAQAKTDRTSHEWWVKTYGRPAAQAAAEVKRLTADLDAALGDAANWKRHSTDNHVEVERLRGALAELLSVAERTRGGDPTLNPEEWYAIRDYCRVLLAGDTGEAGT